MVVVHNENLSPSTANKPATPAAATAAAASIISHVTIILLCIVTEQLAVIYVKP